MPSSARADGCWPAASRSPAGGEIGLFADPDGNVVGLWHRKSGGSRRRREGRRRAGPAAPRKTASRPAAEKPKKKK